MYRFGDGTPFPLNENFIETLLAAVDAAVRLYGRQAEQEHKAAQVREASQTAADELRRLDALRSLLDTAVTPMKGKPNRTRRESEVAAEAIFSSAESVLRQSRAKILRRRDSVVQEAAPPAVSPENLSDLASFFLRYQLPRTEWRLRWDATEGASVVEIAAQATRNLELAFEAAIPDDSEWVAALPITELLPHCQVEIQTSGSRPRTIRLQDCAVTQVQVGAGREAMVLHETSRRSSPGIHVVMPGPSERAPLVVPLDKRNQPAGQPYYLDEIGSSALFALWRGLSDRFNALLNCRTTLTSARLGGRDVVEIDHPSTIADALLVDLAPLTREVRARSRVPGELILKRDLGDDRREELFISRQSLLDKIAALPSHLRRLFAAIGLVDESHEEPRAPRAPAPGPAPAQRSRAIARSSASPTPTGTDRSVTIEIEADEPSDEEIAQRSGASLLPGFQFASSSSGPARTAYDTGTMDGPTLERHPTIGHDHLPSELSGIIDSLS